MRIDADPEEPARYRKPAVSLIGDAAQLLRKLIDALREDQHQTLLRGRRKCRSGRRAMRKRLAKLAPQLAFLEAIRAELPEDGIFVDEVTQLGFAARLVLTGL